MHIITAIISTTLACTVIIRVITTMCQRAQTHSLGPVVSEERHIPADLGLSFFYVPELQSPSTSEDESSVWSF